MPDQNTALTASQCEQLHEISAEPWRSWADTVRYILIRITTALVPISTAYLYIKR
jgi:hypothetical protein